MHPPLIVAQRQTLLMKIEAELRGGEPGNRPRQAKEELPVAECLQRELCLVVGRAVLLFWM
jgi:hypothetical protein